jgi:hypothetical protein
VGFQAGTAKIQRPFFLIVPGTRGKPYLNNNYLAMINSCTSKLIMAVTDYPRGILND